MKASMIENKSTTKSKLAMLILALTPILSMYGTMLNYAIWLFLLLIGYLVISSNKKSLTYFPKYYNIYWVFLALDYFVLTRKLGAIIPGGLSFFVFSIILIFISRQFEFSFYRKYLRFILLVAIALFFAQEFMWYTTGSRFVPVLPLGNLTTTMTYSEMVARNLAAERSASIFLEPAHFAVYLLLGLMMELGAYQGKRIFSGFAILIIITLLMLRSGTALAGLGVMLLYKFTFYLRKLSTGKKIFAAVLISLITVGAISFYLRTEIGTEMSERSQNELTLDEDGHSFVRFAAGAMIYSDLPIINKIVGASDDTLLPIARKYAGFFADDDANALYMNGWATALTHTGIIGFLLLLLVLINLYKSGNELSRSGIWLFVALSFFSQTYTQPIMLITMIIATYYQHQNKTIQLSSDVKQ